MTVSWEGPASCARPATLDEEIGRRLGADAARAAEANVEVRVREQDAGGYLLSLRVERSRERAEREVVLGDCEEVRRAAVLLIATALAPEEQIAAPAEPEPETPHETRAWSLRAGVIGDLRALPGPTVGPSFGLGYDGERVRLWVEARYLAARRSGELAEVPVDLDLFAGAVGGAFVWRRGGFTFGPAAEVEVGAERARSAGPRAVDAAGWADWESAWLGALIDWEARARFGVSLVALAGVPLRRAVFEVEDVVVHETEPVTARLQLVFRLLLGTKKSGGGGQ